MRRRRSLRPFGRVGAVLGQRRRGFCASGGVAGGVSGRSCSSAAPSATGQPPRRFTNHNASIERSLYRLAACLRLPAGSQPRSSSSLGDAVFGLDQFGKHRFVRPATRASPQAGQPVQLVRISPDYPVPARDGQLAAREPNRRESSGTASLAASPAYEPDRSAAIPKPPAIRDPPRHAVANRSDGSCRADGQSYRH